MSFFGNALYGFFQLLFLVLLLFPFINYFAIKVSGFVGKGKMKLAILAYVPTLFCFLPYLALLSLGQFLSNSSKDMVMMSTIGFVVLSAMVTICSLLYLGYHYLIKKGIK